MTTNINRYFFKGVEGVPAEFHRSKNAVKDKTEAYQGSNKFNGHAVTAIENAEGKKTVFVDEAVEITTVPDTVRQAAQNNWNQLAEKSHKTFVATLITGIVLTVAGLAMAGAAFVCPPLIIAAVPTFVLGVTLLVVAKRGYTNEKNAKLKHAEWKDPVPAIQAHRKQASPDKQGFNYVFQRKILLGQCFHQDEVTHLREEHLTKFVNDHESGIARNDMNTFKSFFKLNPFSHDAVKFASGERKDHGMETLVKAYGDQESMFNNLLREIQERRDRVESERKSTIHSLKITRDSALSSLHTIYLTPNILLETEKNMTHFDERTRTYVSSIGFVRLFQIEAQIAANKESYRREAAPVHAVFERGKKRANTIAREKNAKIDEYERTEILKYKQPIKELLAQFRTQIKPVRQASASEGATAPSLDAVNGAEKPTAPMMEQEDDDCQTASVYPPVPSAPPSYDPYDAPPGN